MTVTGRQILDHLQARQHDIVNLLESLTLAESPSSVAESQMLVAEILEFELKDLGFLVRQLPGTRTGGALYARPVKRPRHRPLQLLLGHFDTVWPMGTLADMPFRVDGNVVRGPGVFDMKGGLVQTLFALRALRDLSLEPQLTPVVFLNSDEEIGSRESGRYIHALAKRANRAFVMEPAMGPEGVIKTARKGVGRFTVKACGKSAHAGLDPESGASAILELSHVIQKLFALNDPDRGITVNVGTIDGGIRPNVVAPESTAVIDVRVAGADDAAQIEAAILALEPETPGVTLEVDGQIGRPPLEPTPANRALWHMARNIGADMGLNLREGLAGGGSDGSTTSQYTATLDGLGAVGDGAHARHEHLLLDKTIERAALLAMLLLAPPLGSDSR